MFTFSSIYAQVIWGTPSGCDSYGNRSITAKITNTTFATKSYRVSVFKNGNFVHEGNKFDIPHNATQELHLGGIPTGTDFELRIERNGTVFKTNVINFGTCFNRPSDVVSFQSPSYSCDSNNNRSISVSIQNKSGYGRDYKITVYEGNNFIHGGLDEYIKGDAKIKLSGIPADGRRFEIRVERDRSGQAYKRKSYTFNICTSSDIIQFDPAPSGCDGYYNRSFGVNVTNNGFAGNYKIVVREGGNEIHKTNRIYLPHGGNQYIVLAGIPTNGNLEVRLEKDGNLKRSESHDFKECFIGACNGYNVGTGQLQNLPQHYHCTLSYKNLILYYNPSIPDGGNVNVPYPQYIIASSKAEGAAKLNHEAYEFFKDRWKTNLKDITNDNAGIYTKNRDGKLRAVLGAPLLIDGPPAYSTRELIQYNDRSRFESGELVYHEMFHQYQWAYFNPVGDIYFNNSGFFESMAQYAALVAATNVKPTGVLNYRKELKKSDQDPWDPNYSGSIFYEWLVDEYFRGDNFNMYETLLSTAKTVKDNWPNLPYISLPNDFEGLDVYATKQAVNDDIYVQRYRNWTLTNNLTGVAIQAKKAVSYTYDLITNTSRNRKADINTGHTKIYKIRHSAGQNIRVNLSNENLKDVYVSIVTNAHSTTNRPSIYRMVNNSYFNIKLGSNTESYVVVSPSIEDGNQDDIKVEISKIASLKQSTEKNEFASTNYPNPFKDKTTIAFNLESESKVSLKIYNATGIEMTTLLDKVNYQKGKHIINFDGAGYPPGIYYYSIQSNDNFDMQKMILMK